MNAAVAMGLYRNALTSVVTVNAAVAMGLLWGARTSVDTVIAGITAGFGAWAANAAVAVRFCRGLLSTTKAAVATTP